MASVARIIAMKNSSDTTRNQTQDRPACNAVPQPTAPSHASLTMIGLNKRPPAPIKKIMFWVLV
jgi:hypothetical protein